MKSFVVLASLLVLGVVVSAESDPAMQKYLRSLPPNVMDKCLKESHLEADKDKLLADASTVESGKFDCLVACTLRENGVLVNGELKFDVLAGLLGKLLTDKEDKLEQRLEVIKSCIPEGNTAKSDCEKIGKILQCKYGKLKQMGH